jgi:site-specific recombinase XerD
MSGTEIEPVEAREITLARELERASAYAQASKAPSTLRAYASDWRIFSAWCAEHGVEALPSTGETLALFLAAEADAGRKASTIARRAAAVAAYHQAAGFEAPTRTPQVRAVSSGIRRTIGTRQAAKGALAPSELRAMLATLDASTLAGKRDAALLLVGFAGALRRSELVALDSADVDERPEGLVLTIRRSKTDQEAAGRVVGIPYAKDSALCPVLALRRYRDAAAITTGPLFRRLNRWGTLGAALTAQSVALVVKRAAAAAGLDANRFAGHSLRAGLATAAAAAGASERAIMAQTGHRSIVVARRYIRPGSVFLENAASAVL